MGDDLHQMKICLIRQPAGIGDILFCKKIGVIYNSFGFEVNWPITKAMENIIPYIETPYINYIPEGQPFPNSDLYSMPRFSTQPETGTDFKYLPLQFSTDYLSGLIMDSKYKLAGIDYSDWVSYMGVKRNKEKEKALYHDILNLKKDEDYILANWTYGSYPNSVRRPFPINTESKKVIEITDKDGFSVFDWCKVIENAETIHMMDTCFSIIAEALTLKAKSLFLYGRYSDSYKETIYLFKKPWELSACL
jgi:hypothetical protein